MKNAAVKNGQKYAARPAQVEDITENKKAEEELRQSEEKYRGLFELAPIGITTLDMKGIVTSCNPAVLGEGGYTADDLVGKHFSKTAPIRVRDIPKYIKAFNSTIRGKVPAPFEVNYTRKDGTPGWAEVHASLLRDGRKKLGILVLQRDITEHKRAEEALRLSAAHWESTFEAIGDAICLLDSEGRITQCNSAMLELAKKSQAEVAGRTCCEYIHGTQAHLKGCPWVRMLKTHRRETAELTIGNKWFEVTIDPVLDTDNKVVSSVHIVSDITERKQAEEEVREFKLIADSAAYGVAIGTVDGMLTYVNRSFAQMHGYTPDELVGRHFSILYTEEQMPIIQKLRDQLMQTGSFAGEEMWHRRKDGTVFPTIMTGNLMRDEKGNPSYLVGTTVDITERKRAEEEITKFKTIADIANYGVCICDLKRTLIYVNECYAQMHGYAVDELVGQHFPIVYPEWEWDHALQMFNQLKKRGEIENEEVWHKRKDGSVFPSLMNSTALRDDTGKPNLLFAITVDITERKKAEEALRESEEKYRGLIEDSHVGIAVSDLEGKFTFVNQALCEMIGYSKDESLGRYFIDFIHPEDREEILSMFREGIAAPNGAVDFEFRIIHKKGHVVYMTASPMPLKEGDKLAGVIALITDITQVKRQEELIHELAEVTRQERAEISSESALSVAPGRPLTPLQKRFVKSGLEGFDDREAIELLTSICPRGRNETFTKDCFKAFANIREIMSASQEELEQAGFAPRCILYLKLLREIPREVLRERIRERAVYESSKEVFDYLYFSMRDLKEELFKIA